MKVITTISEPICFTKENFLSKLPLVLKAVEALGKGAYEIIIKEHRQKRSLNANAYAWELMGRLAENQGIEKEEVYRHHVRAVGVYRQVEINEEAEDTLKHSWGLNGIGWIAERVDYTQHEGFVLVNLYYGSSTYNTKQMSRLIDNIVQDCEAVGIPTKTPNEIAKLKALWGEAPKEP
ncbi:MAG: hypothetical protein HFE77_03225 [Clostridiales bacterium]|nr:hypothetical protein [Clostridiales bacterium]